MLEAGAQAVKLSAGVRKRRGPFEILRQKYVAGSLAGFECNTMHSQALHYFHHTVQRVSVGYCVAASEFSVRGEFNALSRLQESVL